MASNDTEEQLKNLDKETIIRLFLAQKEQLENLDHTLQLVLEQLADLKRHRFGRSTERHETDGQILFMEIDGKIVFFNEAEAVAGDTGDEQDEEADNIPQPKPRKKKGKREEDLRGTTGCDCGTFHGRKGTGGIFWGRWMERTPG